MAREGGAGRGCCASRVGDVMVTDVMECLLGREGGKRGGWRLAGWW